MEEMSFKEKAGLSADTMLPPMAGGRFLWYIAAVTAVLLLSALPLLPVL